MINEQWMIELTVEEATSYAQQNGYKLRVVQQGDGYSPYVASPQSISEKVVDVVVKDDIVIEVKGIYPL